MSCNYIQAYQGTLNKIFNVNDRTLYSHLLLNNVTSSTVASATSMNAIILGFQRTYVLFILFVNFCISQTCVLLHVCVLICKMHVTYVTNTNKTTGMKKQIQNIYLQHLIIFAKYGLAFGRNKPGILIYIVPFAIDQV